MSLKLHKNGVMSPSVQHHYAVVFQRATLRPERARCAERVPETTFGRGLTVRAAVAKYGIKKSTLGDKLVKIRNSIQKQRNPGRRCAFNADEEAVVDET